MDPLDSQDTAPGVANDEMVWPSNVPAPTDIPRGSVWTFWNSDHMQRYRDRQSALVRTPDGRIRFPLFVKNCGPTQWVVVFGPALQEGL